MRTETFLMIRKSCIRQKLRDVLQWPIKISQFLGCFPFQLNSNNEFVLQWNGYPMICTIIWFFANLILITYYFMNKEEIVNDIMGGFTNTENYASSLISGLILIIDKFMTIYSIVLRKYTIKFQARLNKVFEYIVNEVDNSNSSLPPSTCILRNPYSYIEKESKCVRKIGMIFLALGLVFEITSALFHSARLFNPTSDIFKKIALMVVCTLGQCSLTIPKLCYLYYLSSIICLFKGGFLMMKDITKHLSNCCGSLVDGREISDNEKNWINLLLEMHSKLEKLVVKYNQAFGLQLLGCMIISLVLITGYSFLICANIRFNFWYVMVVAIPLTAVHCLTLTFLCHNASYMTILVSLL